MHFSTCDYFNLHANFRHFIYLYRLHNYFFLGFINKIFVFALNYGRALIFLPIIKLVKTYMHKRQTLSSARVCALSECVPESDIIWIIVTVKMITVNQVMNCLEFICRRDIKDDDILVCAFVTKKAVT